MVEAESDPQTAAEKHAAVPVSCSWLDFDETPCLQEYVCRLAELLVEAKSDPETAAGKRAAVLVREAVTLAATISIHNPRGYRTW